MNTKHKGDLAEQAAALEALKRGWGVLRPIGDNLPYDLVFDISGSLVKVQVKCAWQDDASGNFVVDTRRTQTNRRIMVRKEYQPYDFDFALVYLPACNLFYIFPVETLISYGSEIHMVEMAKRQRRPRSWVYREAWHALASMAESHRSSSFSVRATRFVGRLKRHIGTVALTEGPIYIFMYSVPMINHRYCFFYVKTW